MSTGRAGEESASQRIAIIGMAGRFPGASDIGELWGNLLAGEESLTEITDEQLRRAGVPEGRISNPYYNRKRPLMDDMEYFDAGYFGYHPREADIADPQQRLFLEVCHTALQHAGYDTDRHPGSVGVFGGSGPATYHFRNVYYNADVRAAVGDMAVEINNSLDYLATRVAHTLGLEGPAVTMVTACSTSLVAIHSACQSLAAGECGMAVAGGVNILLPYYAGQQYAENSIYSRDGHARVFDAEATGTNFGHGAGAVVLKRYEDAVAAGDHIEAVVLASAVNNDGARRQGFTAPSHEGQVEVISRALEASGVHPDTIGYVEAHGTATAVGDPIEVTALTAAYRQAGATGVQDRPIGSLKANIGHLGPAAGVAGLIKATLVLKHGVIPPAINFSTPNPRIDFPQTPFHVNTDQLPWPARDTPKRAGVSSFGIGGTNAHLIVEEAPRTVPQPVGGQEKPGTHQVLTLSARTETALAAVRAGLAAHLRDNPDLPLADVAHTLQVGRRELRHRTSVVAADTSEAVAALERENVPEHLASGRARITFLFPGQGNQRVGMAAELYASEPHFADIVDQCLALLDGPLAAELRPLLCEPVDQAGESVERATRMLRTDIAQPALFIVEYALARLWMSWGVEPAAMVGHSVGEYTAACLAGVFDLAGALRLVALRGQLTQSMPGGDMLAVPMAESDIAPMLHGELSLAAVNSPKSCVVAGPAEDIKVLRQWLESNGVRGQLLQTSHAFHSAMLDPVLQPFRESVAEAAPQPPEIPFVSTLTGTWITDEQAADPGYWADQLRGTVLFAQACRTAAEDGTALLETGPGQSLTTMARQTLGRDASVVPSLPRQGSERTDGQCLAEAAGQLWSRGARIDWEARRNGAARRRVALPPYPYERSRHWVDADADADGSAGSGTGDGEAASGLLAAGDSTFLPTWRRRPLAPLEEEGPDLVTGPWLLFGADSGPLAAIADELVAGGTEVVRVETGESFAETGPGRYTVRPGHRPDYDTLLTALAAGPGRPARIVHGWTVTPVTEDGLDTAAVEEVLDTGFHSLLFLSQLLLEHWPDEPVDLRVLTSRGVDVLGDEPVEPAKSLLIGPCKVIPHESPQVSCLLVDLDEATASSLLAVRELLAELTAPVTDRQVAYRAGRRWVADHERISLPPRAELPSGLRRRGVYLVTGGLGGIGLETARELARTSAARLVLVGRSALPERDAWDDHLTAAGPEDPVSRRIIGVREIEELGGEVLVAAADVADEAAMRKVVDAANERFGRVHGVFHAAGVPGGGLAALRTAEQARAVLSPKVDGTLVLDRLLGDQIELMVLFSSIVSVSGDYGMVDYCSANAFLDAYAQYRQRTGNCRTLAVNWCGWSDVGMIGNTKDSAPQAFRALEMGQDASASAHPLLGHRFDDGDGVTFAIRCEPGFHWVLTDHLMGGQQVFPGTSFIEMMRAAYEEVAAPGPVELLDVAFSRPLSVHQPVELQLRGERLTGEGGDGGYAFTVRSRVAHQSRAPWQYHARATVVPHRESAEPEPHDVRGIAERCDDMVWTPDPELAGHAVAFGPHWPTMGPYRIGDGEHLVELALPEGADGDIDDFVLHPSLLDGATSLSLFLPELVADGRSFLPTSYRRLIVRGPLPARLRSFVRSTEIAADLSGAVSDIAVLDEHGREIVTVEGLGVSTVEAGLAEAPGTAAAPRSAGATASAAAPSPSSEPVPAGEVEGEETLLITSKEGISLLWRVLGTPAEAQFVVSREPVAQRMRRVARMASAIETADSGELVSGGRSAERSLGAVPEDATPTEQGLLDLWQNAFGLSRVGLDEDFFDLGGNSLVAVQLAVRIRESLGVSVPGVAILEYPSVRELAQRVDEIVAETAG